MFKKTNDFILNSLLGLYGIHINRMNKKKKKFHVNI